MIARHTIDAAGLDRRRRHLKDIGEIDGADVQPRGPSRALRAGADDFAACSRSIS